MTMMLTTMLVAAQVAAPSKIEQVVVYADRAEVARTLSAKCEGGAALAVFEGLPETLLRRTLRGRARTGVAIGTTAAMVEGQEVVGEQARLLEAELEALMRQRSKLDGELGALGHDEQLRGAYASVLQAVSSEGMRNPRPPTGKWAAGLDALRKRHADGGGRRAEIHVEVQRNHRTQQRIRRQLGQLGVAASKRSIEATVTVDCGQQSKVSVVIEYVVPGARWRPEYDVDFRPNGKAKVGPGRARLTVSAIIEQSTGEDWRDVKLALSTAKPRLGVEPPPPAPQWIDGYEDESGKVLVQASERRTKLEQGAGVAGATTSVLEDRGQSFALKMKRPVTIVADGRPYWVPVDVLELSATSKLVTVPKIRPYVYQLVRFDNPAPYPLLAGKIHSFRRGSFVGASSLRYRGPGEPMEVSLGVDESLRVDRKRLEHVDKDPRFLSSTKKMIRGFRVELANRSARSQTIEVRENIPVSKIEDVHVAIDERTTKGYALDEHQGFLTWQVPLASGASGQVDLAYTIALPDDWKVQ